MTIVRQAKFRSVRCVVFLACLLALSATVDARTLFAWGEAGHRIIAQAAVVALPAEMPAFFRNASAQLAYLNPEPDRWRSRTERDRDSALEAGSSTDHFLDTELIPAERRANAFAAQSRYAYADTLRSMGISALTTGFLPFRVLELSQRLRVEFGLWRSAPNTQTREWIEARIINDAGILGHYVADGSNPAHLSVQHNGWTGPNPNGYATDKRFHSRFESGYVQAQITLTDVQPLVGAPGRTHRDLRPAIVHYLSETFAEVEPLYRLDQAVNFGAETTSSKAKRYTAARLAAGSRMLRDLWWTAWVTSDSSQSR